MPVDQPATVPDLSITEHHLDASVEHGGCGGCPIARREFLREGAILATAAVAAIAIPAKASGLSARFASAFRHSVKDARYAVPSSDGATIDRDNDVIIARVGGAVYALDLSCPHQRTAIRWRASDNRFECPKHHSQYSPAGIYLQGRATRSLDRLPIRRDGDQLVVDVDTVYRQDRDRSKWDAAVVQL
jgi:Rieske Fe-S protein